MNQKHLHFIIAISLVVLAVYTRIYNAQLELPNFSPISAVGFFSFAVMKERRLLAFFVPLLGQFATDLFFHYFTNTPGFYPGMGYNYAAIALASLLGMLLKQTKPFPVFFGLLSASTVFFIVSNLGYFMGGYNGFSLAGLVKTYRDAIPFYQNTLIGDMVGGCALFLGYSLITSKIANTKAEAQA
ncbi:MAG: hypothetical protein EBX41_05840 [Chitinophagia bacterium]|nr:hypothetical protein [Chitinophagia bacterium]